MRVKTANAKHVAIKFLPHSMIEKVALQPIALTFDGVSYRGIAIKD